MSGISAIHDKRMAYGERGQIRAEEQNHISHLLRLRDAAHRRVGQEMGADIGVREPMFGHASLD